MAREIEQEYPDGEDPLLEEWRAGRRTVHPRWFDAVFWIAVAAEAEKIAGANQRWYQRHKEQ